MQSPAGSWPETRCYHSMTSIGLQLFIINGKKQLPGANGKAELIKLADSRFIQLFCCSPPPPL